ITAWDAGWNVSNAIQGMFVLGLPYAVLHGGYLGLLLIIVTAVVCCYTGNILIECFMGCSVAQIVVLGITIIYCVTKIDTWAWGEITFSVDMRQFPVSIGVIVFSYTSQIFLPSLEGSMENRGEFRSMLSWSYVASCVTKATFALVCFLTWSKDTKDVVTDNLPPTLRALINVLLVVKALLSYPLPYYQAIEVMEQEVFKGATASGDLQIWALVLRGGLVLGTLLMGVFIPHFALLMGLTGSLTGTSLAFLFPCAFHIQIKWNEMRWREVALDAFIFISGCLCGITGIYFSIVGLYD
uniref:Vesicular inhibitory amino acid transporter n=1 Tax=Ciona savignyi TaxID=51511 RepID=H2ZJK7_CIOSA